MTDGTKASSRREAPVSSTPRSPLSYALRPELDRLEACHIALVGDHDTFGFQHSVKNGPLMPDGRCDVIRHAGHMVSIDQPNICAERIDSFLTG